MLRKAGITHGSPSGGGGGFRTQPPTVSGRLGIRRVVSGRLRARRDDDTAESVGRHTMFPFPRTVDARPGRPGLVEPRLDPGLGALEGSKLGDQLDELGRVCGTAAGDHRLKQTAALQQDDGLDR